MNWSRIHFFSALLAVAALSVLPADQLPGVGFSIWDKAQHALAFFVLTLLGIWAYPGRTLAVVISMVAFGVCIELAQWSLGWRQGEWLDLLADILGVAIAIMLWHFRVRRQC